MLDGGIAGVVIVQNDKWKHTPRGIKEIENRLLVEFGHSDEGTPVWGSERERLIVARALNLAEKGAEKDMDDARLQAGELLDEIREQKKEISRLKRDYKKKHCSWNVGCYDKVLEKQRSKFLKVLEKLKKEMEQKWMETRGRGVSRIKCNAQLETVEHLIKYLEERDKG